MAASSVNGHTQEFEELAGLAALDVLDGDERDRFEAHAAGCERCRVIVRLDRQALRGLSLSAPEMDPSPDFKQRLMQRAADELAQRQTAEPAPPAAPAPAPATEPLAPVEPQAPAPEPIPLRPPGRVVPFRRQRAWLTALAAVLVLGLGSLGVLSYMNQVVATYSLSSPGVPGTATVIVHRSGQAELRMDGVPDPAPGFVYEAWIIHPGQAPVAAGTLTSGQGSVGLTGSVRGTTVAITKEPTPVPPGPSSQPIMATAVES
jgi:hypothetical protein